VNWIYKRWPALESAIHARWSALDVVHLVVGLAVILLGILLFVVLGNISGDFDWDVVFDNKDLLIKGLRNTVWLSLVSMSFALVFGLVLALMRLSPWRVISWPASLYINIVRGIPLLVLIFYVFFGLALWLDITFTNFQAGVISLVIFHTAFMAEIYRAGLQAVPAGQREAAQSLGMSVPRAFFSITLPQALRISIPTSGNDFVGMVKDTSLVGIIGIFELYRTGQKLVSDTFLPFEVWTGVAIMYIVVVFVIDIIVRLLERGLRPGMRTVGPIAKRRARKFEELAAQVRASEAVGLT
jgi:His/Glu/Gln/Arg/opine family amino acid ABC transporter permease subunit